MPGSSSGNKKGAETLKERYGEDYFKKLGAKGGAKSTNGGFYANRELARKAGKIGGRMSKRGKAKVYINE